MTDLKNPRWKYYFPCGQWLAKNEGDGNISRDLVGSSNPLATRKSTYQLYVLSHALLYIIIVMDAACCAI